MGFAICVIGSSLHVSTGTFEAFRSISQSPNNPARKRPVSERRIQANRKNALRSTGPKTARGKQLVARNATKHGILAREVVITAGDGEENLAEFQALVERLWERARAGGSFRGITRTNDCNNLVEGKGRVIRAENGEIRKRLDTAGMDQLLRNSDKGNLALLLMDVDLNWYHAENQADGRVSTMDRWSALQAVQADVRADHSGLEYLSGLLRTAKSEIETKGHIPERLQDKISGAFSSWDYMFAFLCLQACSSEDKAEGSSSENVEDKKSDNSLLLALIDRRLAKIGLLQEHAYQHERLARDTEVRRLSLPPADATDKLLRYESHLDRQLYRAMDELERLQRQRRGENVLPPLNVNLGRRR